MSDTVTVNITDVDQSVSVDLTQVEQTVEVIMSQTGGPNVLSTGTYTALSGILAGDGARVSTGDNSQLNLLIAENPESSRDTLELGASDSPTFLGLSTTNRPTVNGTGVLLQGEITSEADTLATVTSRGATTNDLVSFGAGIEVTGEITFNTNTNTTPTVGQLTWNNEENTLDVGLDNDVVLQVGEEQLVNVKAAEDIKNGQAVYASGASGGGSGNIVVSLYRAGVEDVDELRFLGVATQDISNNEFGYVTTFGKVRNVLPEFTRATDDPEYDLNYNQGWEIGTILYISAEQPGKFTSIAPESPDKTIPTAIIIANNGNQRTFFVRAEHGYHINELHDVKITDPSDNQILTYSETLSSWENKSLSDIADNSYVNQTGDETINGVKTFTDRPTLNGTGLLIEGEGGVWDENGSDIYYNDGNVGIGTASPSQKLTVSGNISASGDLIVDADTLYVDSVNDRVGIGVTDPDEKLEVAGVIKSVDTNTFRLWDGNVLETSSTTINLRTESGNAKVFTGLTSWTGTWSDAVESTYFQVGDNNGHVVFSAGQGTAIERLAFIVNDNSANDGVIFTDTTSSITPNTQWLTVRLSGANRFTLSKTGDGYFQGNVGIGTTTPSYKLDVNGDANISTSLTVGTSLDVGGHFSAVTKSFLINHPTKPGKKLQYGVVESDQHSVFVRGISTEDTIVLPEEWEGLVHEDSVTVQLTPVGSYQQLYVVSQNSKQVVVGGATGKYNYTIYGERKDVAKLETEV